MENIKTPIGFFKITYDEETEYFYCKLYDDKEHWIANIIHKETIKRLKKIKNFENLVDIGISKNIIWDKDLRELFSTYCDILELEYYGEERQEAFETFKDYVNEINGTYFVLDFDEI